MLNLDFGKGDRRGHMALFYLRRKQEGLEREVEFMKERSSQWKSNVEIDAAGGEELEALLSLQSKDINDDFAYFQSTITVSKIPNYTFASCVQRAVNDIFWSYKPERPAPVLERKDDSSLVDLKNQNKLLREYRIPRLIKELTSRNGESSNP